MFIFLWKLQSLSIFKHKITQLFNIQYFLVKMLIEETMETLPYMGPYQVVAKIEQGTQSNILLGRNKEKFYGLKVYKHGHIGRRSFQKETEILCSIHDQLVLKPVEIYRFETFDSGDFTEEAVQPFLVMQYFENGDLRHFINNGTIPIRIRNYLIKNMARCLLALEVCGIVHRDIKPENFLVDYNYNLKIIDFGVAMRTWENKQQLVGTPNYIAPEIYKSKTYTSKSDIFAVGVILFQLIFGRKRSFPFKEAKITDCNYLLLKQKMYGKFWVKFQSQKIQPQVKQFLQKILSPNPEERPTASQILQYDCFKQEASQMECASFFQMLKPPSKIPYFQACITF